MDATEKAKWIEEAAKDKERFNRENAAYIAKQNGPSGQAQAEHSNVKLAILANVEGASKQADEGIDAESNARINDRGTSMELDEKKRKDEEDQGNGEIGREAGKRNVVDATGETDVAQKAKGKDFGVRYKANPGSLVKQARGKGGNKQLKGDEMNQGGVIGGDVQSSSSSTSCPSGNVSPSIAKYFAFLFTQWSGVRQVGNCHDRHLALLIELKIDMSGKSKRLAERNPGASVEAMDRNFRRIWKRRSSSRPC